MKHPTSFASWSLFAALFLGVSAVAACKPRQAESGAELKGNVLLESSPPKVMYHFGAYRYLHGFGKTNGTFSYSDWNAMPSLTPKYGGSSRAGFYLSQHPAYNERYGDEDVNKSRDDSPWMMTVTLADACTESGRWLDVRRSGWSNCTASDYTRSQ